MCERWTFTVPREMNMRAAISGSSTQRRLEDDVEFGQGEISQPYDAASRSAGAAGSDRFAEWVLRFGTSGPEGVVTECLAQPR